MYKYMLFFPITTLSKKVCSDSCVPWFVYKFFFRNSSESNRMETTPNFTSKSAWVPNSEALRRKETHCIRQLGYYAKNRV